MMVNADDDNDSNDDDENDNDDDDENDQDDVSHSAHKKKLHKIYLCVHSTSISLMSISREKMDSESAKGALLPAIVMGSRIYLGCNTSTLVDTAHKQLQRAKTNTKITETQQKHNRKKERKNKDEGTN